MALPEFECPTRDLEVEGQKVTIRGLTRRELHAVGTQSTPEAVETAMVGFAFDATYVEAEAWMATAPSLAAQTIVESIMELSGMGDDVPKA